MFIRLKMNGIQDMLGKINGICDISNRYLRILSRKIVIFERLN